MADRVAGARLPCLVPGCRRTLRAEEPDDTLGICPKHWQSIPLVRRKVYRRLRKDRRDLRATVGSGFTIATAVRARRLSAAIGRIWARLERDAVERSFGI